jgi:acetyl-CoA carboxylase biotin carboxyl carrier protein
MSDFEIDAEAIRKLAELLKETGLHEIEYAEGDKRIRCVSTPPVQPFQIAGQAPVQQAPEPAAESKVEAPKGTPVTAPMVGTVYLSSAPDAPAFVKTGDTVKAGDTLLIIEAMKVMNPIKAPQDGIIADILVSDAKPVEFGETLMLIG